MNEIKDFAGTRYHEKFNSVDELHKKYPWKSVQKFGALAKRYGFSMKDVKEFMSDKVIHDEKIKKPEYLPVYGKETGCYQMDTFIQRGGINYLMIININTRKAYSYPLKNKGKKEVLNALNKFFDEVKDVKSITSDQDTAYLSWDVLEFLNEKGVKYYTTEDNNHNVLGIINRFMRTVRDMNESMGNKGNINEEQMKEIVDIYNNSPHKSINMNPNEMNESEEKKYIEEKKKETMEKEKDYDLNAGDRVRVVLEKNKIGKNRSNLSQESYIVDSKIGKQYLIVAKNRSADKYPGYKLVKCSEKVPLAKTIKNNKRGIVEKIISYNEKTDKYKVFYEGEKKPDIIPSKNLREGFPLKLSMMEREYWVKQKNIPVNIRKWI